MKFNDDYYEYDDEALRLVGKRKGKIYSIGDKLEIKVKRS